MELLSSNFMCTENITANLPAPKTKANAHNNINVPGPGTQNSSKKNDKNSTKKVLVDQTSFRKSVRLLLRKRLKTLSKTSNGVPKPIDMPRTVEFFNGFCEDKDRTDELKVIYLAGLGLYPNSDERGIEYQRELIEKKCEKLASYSLKDSPINSPAKSLSPSDVTTIEESNISSISILLSDRTGISAPEDNWDVKLNIVITPLRRKSVDAVINSENDLDYCNDTDNENEDEWQYFGNYIEDQLKNEEIVKPNYCIQEIKEAKIKLANIMTEWSYHMKNSSPSF